MLRSPSHELPVAAGLLAELDWMAAQISGEGSEARALGRQAAVAHVLFTGVDDPDAAPSLSRFLVDNEIDLDAILASLQPGAGLTPLPQRSERLERARTRLRPYVEAALACLPPGQRNDIEAAMRRRHENLSVEASAIVGRIETPLRTKSGPVRGPRAR